MPPALYEIVSPLLVLVATVYQRLTHICRCCEIGKTIEPPEQVAADGLGGFDLAGMEAIDCFT